MNFYKTGFAKRSRKLEKIRKQREIPLVILRGAGAQSKDLLFYCKAASGMNKSLREWGDDGEMSFPKPLSIRWDRIVPTMNFYKTGFAKRGRKLEKIRKQREIPLVILSGAGAQSKDLLFYCEAASRMNKPLGAWGDVGKNDFPNVFLSNKWNCADGGILKDEVLRTRPKT